MKSRLAAAAQDVEVEQQACDQQQGDHRTRRICQERVAHVALQAGCRAAQEAAAGARDGIDVAPEGAGWPGDAIPAGPVRTQGGRDGHGERATEQADPDDGFAPGLRWAFRGPGGSVHWPWRMTRIFPYRVGAVIMCRAEEKKSSVEL